MTPPLCIIQARYGSRRFPGKMLQTLGGETLIARGWRIASEAFYPANTVVAIPANDMDGPLGDELRRIDAQVFPYSGDESDLLGRFWSCAHTYRWRPESVIVRYTPDDPFKEPKAMQAVAEGQRLPVELGGEAFTLAMLDAAHHNPHTSEREHLTNILFPVAPPPCPAGIWTVDTPEDLAKAGARLNEELSAPVVGNKPRRAPKSGRVSGQS